MTLRFACLVLLLAGFAGVAQAQYQWRDERGRMHYSDMPPPAGIPAERILRGPKPPAPAADAVAGVPGSVAPGAAAPSTAGPGAPGNPEPAAATPAYKDQAMAFEKRRQERAEAEAKAAQAAREAAEKARYCDELEAQRRTLASGARIVTVGADGERRYLDDAARKLRLEENARAIASGCQG